MAIYDKESLTPEFPGRQILGFSKVSSVQNLVMSLFIGSVAGVEGVEGARLWFCEQLEVKV